jgi:hypothetical protein
VAEFDVYPTCPRAFPHWMWDVACGPLEVAWDGGGERVPWFERSTVTVPDDIDSVRFTFVAANQPFARSPKVRVSEVRDRLVLYRASNVPLFFRPRIQDVERARAVPGRWSAWNQ